MNRHRFQRVVLKVVVVLAVAFIAGFAAKTLARSTPTPGLSPPPLLGPWMLAPLSAGWVLQ